MQSELETTSLPADGADAIPDAGALLNAIPAAALITDTHGRILAANGAAAALAGLEPERMPGRSLFELLASRLAEHCRLKLDRLLAEAALGVRQPIRWEADWQDRSYRYTLAAVPPYSEPARRAVWFIEDISEQKRADLAEHMRGLHYRFIVENSADVFWELDAQMRFTFISAADKRERGFEPEEVIGRSIFDILTPASREHVRRIVGARMEQEHAGRATGALRYEVEVITKDGGTLWAEAHSLPYRDAAGKIVGFHGATRNITERKRYETALEEANRKLQAQLEEISALQVRLQEKANRDFLTGLYNRHYLDETLPREFARARREKYPLSLILVDLDHFKHVNDAYGHAAGDAVLKTLASILQREARASDIICRYGGEEFLVVLPNMPRAVAQARAETWRAMLAETPVHYEQCRISLTLSAGVATFPDNGITIERLLRLADDALYRAKHGGRNRVESIEAHEQTAAPPHAIVSLLWKPAYASGHPLIDAEHRELFRLANALLDLALDEEATREAFALAFDALLAHVVEHFAHEEAILCSRGYPRLQEHAAEHRHLVERARELRQQAERNAVPIGILIDFLADEVVAGHMLKADRTFFFLFPDQGAQPAGRVA